MIKISDLRDEKQAYCAHVDSHCIADRDQYVHYPKRA